MYRWLNLVVQCIRTVLHPQHLRRTGMITLVVGTWLTAFNLGDVLLESHLNLRIGIKIFLNYMTPFVVSNAGLLSFEEDSEEQE